MSLVPGSVWLVCSAVLVASAAAWAQGAGPAPAAATALDPQDRASSSGGSTGLPPGHPQIEGPAGRVPAADSRALPPGHPQIGPAGKTPTGEAKTDPTGSTLTAESKTLPPGHPQIGPAGKTPTGEAKALPPGHPPILDADLQRLMRAGGRRDRNRADPSVAPGTVQVLIVDHQEQPVESKTVRLEIVRQTVGEGRSRADRTGVTAKNGIVAFNGLLADTTHRYRVVVRHDSAEYMSTPFGLSRDSGQSVLLHVYPVTPDIGKADIASMTTVYVAPEDEIFQFQVMVNLVNLGVVAWAPRDMVMFLPEGSSAFVGQRSMFGLQMVPEGANSARLTGAVGPGEHSVTLQFQVPRQNTAEQTLRLGLPPHMVEGRVMVESAPSMVAMADAFSGPVTTRNPEGQRLQVLSYRLAESGQPATELRLRLSGLPVQAGGRWIALVAALGVAAAGLGASRRQVRGIAREEMDEARRVLLEEVVQVERDHANERIGPHTYKQARRELVDALSRLEAMYLSAGQQRGPRRISGGEGARHGSRGEQRQSARPA